MANLNYSIKINAPKEKVWHTMLDLDTNKQWTGPFYPGSYYEGSWDKDSDIKFVAESDGKLSGIQGRVVELGGETVGEDMAKMFEDSWPKSLEKLKETTKHQ